MLMKHINEPPPPIPGISPDLQALIDRALAKDPSLRYESAGDLADEFMAIFNGQTISPGTLHLAEMARQTNDASKQSKVQPEGRRTNPWWRFGIEGTAVLILAFLIYQLIGSGRVTATDPNASVGRMRFSYVAADNDTITFSLASGGSQPAKNAHYETWLVSDKQTFMDVGKITFDPSGIGRLEFTDQNGKNMLDGLKQIEITEEQDGASIIKPTGKVIYSSVFPP